MQEIRSSNPPVVTGICDPNKSRARHHRSFKLGSKLKYLKDMFDFSEYSENSKFYDAIKKVIGKMKGETKDIPVVDFVVSKSKMYSLMKVDSKGDKKAIEINKDVVKNES